MKALILRGRQAVSKDEGCFHPHCKFQRALNPSSFKSPQSDQRKFAGNM